MTNVAELIEKLIIDCLKQRHVYGEWNSVCDKLREQLESHLEARLLQLIVDLVLANADLWDLKQSQGTEVALADAGGMPAHSTLLLGMLRQDIRLCKSRAALREQINAALGQNEADGSTVKFYGASTGKP